MPLSNGFELSGGGFAFFESFFAAGRALGAGDCASWPNS